MATMTVSNPGNMAIETHVWALSMAEAKKVLKHTKSSAYWKPLLKNGGYWWSHFVHPVNTAIRNHRDYVTLFTAGFATPEFSQMLRDSGVDYEIIKGGN